MANDPGDTGQNADPEFRSIMKAVDEVSSLAALNPVSASSVLTFGYLSPELQRKLVALSGMLDSFSRRKTGS